MFTLQQIKDAHSKTKSGADFPKYAQDMKDLGVTKYDHFIADGHTLYFGNNNFTLAGPAKWEATRIAEKPSPEKLRDYITAHQQGLSDYLTICQQAAETGVVKWTCDFINMTCTYYDNHNNPMLVEPIPVA
jgi:uncharacterized protein YbcV (DUF1398 family)